MNTAEKSISTSLQALQAPESWSKYTTHVFTRSVLIKPRDECSREYPVDPKRISWSFFASDGLADYWLESRHEALGLLMLVSLQVQVHANLEKIAVWYHPRTMASCKNKTTIHKSGTKDDITNYRPIYNLCTTSKEYRGDINERIGKWSTVVQYGSE